MHLNNLFGQFRIALSPLGLLFLASALCSQAPGQTISSGATASAAKPPLSSIPEGLFREFGGLIQLDVVVKDSTGTPVAGLDSSRFVVLDNRQPREIRGFVAHGSDAKPDPPVGLILALDLVDMAPEPASRAKEEISKFLQRNGGHLANPVSIFAITSPGLFSSIGPSSDGNALAAALARPQTPSIPCLGSNPRDSLAGMGDPFTGSAIPPNLVSLICLGRMGTIERQKAGRKLLIWVGPQQGISSGAETISFRDPQKAFGAVVWFLTLFREAKISLFSTSVVVPGSDALSKQGMPERSTDGPPIAAGNHRAQYNVAGINSSTALIRPATSAKDFHASDLTRNVLAFESGGGVPEPNLDFVKVVDECARQADTFYSISFDPTAATHLDEYHDIKVQVKEPGLTARTNSGYYDEPFYTYETNPGARRVTVEELEAALKESSGESDADLARQLAGLELSQRLDDATRSNLLAIVRGEKARNAFTALADLASFLPLPSAGTADNPPPAAAEQQRILSMAGLYLNSTITKFPDFIATRKAGVYTEVSRVNMDSSKIDFQPMHLLDSSEAEVFYRQGQEVVDSESAKQAHRPAEKPGLTTYGIFGPSLQIMREIVGDPSLITWGRWEQDSNGRGAVFTYSVPTDRSLYQMKACCLPDGDGSAAFEALSGHHGEIVIDPTSGAVLRFSLLADIKGLLPILKSAVMIAYGPVEVGGQTYICPLRSVSVFTGRSTWDRMEWGWGFLTYGPYETQLSDFEFDKYHRFGSSSRILPANVSTPE